MTPISIEVVCNSLESALNAHQAGAHRVELCDNLYEGGTTPSAGFIQLAREKLPLKIHILIRPCGGDFLYTDLEMELIRRDIIFCKEAGVDGIVCGFLLPDGHIDVARTQQVLQWARPMSFTFHRAFDLCQDPFDAMEQLIHLGVDRILTSGQQNKAAAGAGLIKQLVEQAKNRITIMPGSGIRPDNISQLIEETAAREYHVSARVPMESGMTFRRDGICMGGLAQIPEYEKLVIDANQIRSIMEVVAGYA